MPTSWKKSKERERRAADKTSAMAPRDPAMMRRQSESAIRGVGRSGIKEGARRDTRSQVAPSSRSDRGRSITVPHRVSAAHHASSQEMSGGRGQSPKPRTTAGKGTPGGKNQVGSRTAGVGRSAGSPLERKRAGGKTANPQGRFSKPDLRAVSDRSSRARAEGRRNKHTATVKALKRA